MKRMNRVEIVRAVGGLLLAGMTCMAPGWAAEGATLRDRYPEGAWTSIEQADGAVVAAQAERIEVESSFDQTRRACYKRFFATACVKAAQDARRVRLAAADAVEVEANRYRRETVAAQRERQRREDAEERARVELQEAPQRAANVQAYQQKLAEHAKRQEERVETAADAPRRAAERERLVAEREAELARKASESTTQAPARQQRAAAQAQRVRDAELRQARSAKLQAEREAARKLREAKQETPKRP